MGQSPISVDGQGEATETRPGTITLYFNGVKEEWPSSTTFMWDSGATMGVAVQGFPFPLHETGTVKDVKTIHGVHPQECFFAEVDGIMWPAVKAPFKCNLIPAAALDAEGCFDRTSLTATINTLNHRHTFNLRRDDEGFYYTLGLKPAQSTPLAPHLPRPIPNWAMLGVTETSIPRLSGPAVVAAAAEVRNEVLMGERRAAALRRMGYSSQTKWPVALQSF